MGGGRAAAPSPGWYVDPTGRAELRFWTGQEWTTWVWDGTTVAADQHPVRRALNRSDLEHLEFIDRVFLPEARAGGTLTSGDEAELGMLLRQLTAEASGIAVPWGAQAAPVTTSMPGPAVGPTPLPEQAARTEQAPMPQATPRQGPVFVPPARVQTPRPAPQQLRRSPESAFSRWLARSVKAVGSDLAVHGLAYLGVLMFFVGVFGLVVFAFGDVTPGLRPLAEVVIAIAPFGAGAMLLKRQAITVGRSLEVLGGVLLPIMVLTSFLDGVAFPPDLSGTLLVLVLTAVTAIIAASYAGWSGSHESSGLRYLVAPVAWLAVAVATLGLGRAVPVGRDVASPSAAQVAAIAAALVVTLAWARSRPRARLAGPTSSVAVPGLLVVALLTLLTGRAEGWPTVPVLVCGVLVLTALELLRDRLSVTVLGLAEPLWWAAVWVALVSGVGAAPAGAVAVIGFLAILEIAASVPRPVWAGALPAMGAAAALASTCTDARWATVVFSLAAVWALGRRMVPYALPGSAVALDVAAAVLPVLALASLAVASSPPTAVAAGTGVVLLATLPAVRSWLRRDPGDRFWTLWWRTAGAVTALAAAVVRADNLTVGQQWLITISLVLLATAGAVGPIPGIWRSWPVTALFTAAWLSACATLDAADLVTAGTMAVAGLAIVAAAHSARWGLRRKDVAGSLGLAGHVLGLAAVPVATFGRWSLVVAVGLATAGWVLTAVMDARDLSPVGQALRCVGGWAVWLPLWLAAVGIPVTVALGLDTAGVLRLADPWAMAVPALTAVVYAAATWLRLPDLIGATAAWAGFVAGVLASAVAGERLPQVLGFAALVVSVAVLRPRRRAPVMTWAAWVVLAPLSGLAAAQWWPWFGGLEWQTAVPLTLVAVGAVLLVGGAASDLRGRPWAPRYVPSHTSAVAPVVMGGVELVASVALAHLTLTGEQLGWVSVAAAVAVVATALLARLGALAAVGIVRGWIAVVLLAGDQIDARPWIPVVVALVLLVVAQLLFIAGAEARAGRQWWARWDLPLLVAAAPVAATALFAAGGSDNWGPTYIAVGLESLVVTVRWRRVPAVAVPAGVISTALVLAGAGNAGQGWLALALLGLSVALTAVAASTHGSVRLPFQIGGALAALASSLVTMGWLGWTAQQSADVLSVGAGLLAMAAASVSRVHRVERSWLVVWGGMAVALAALVAGCTGTIAGEGLAGASAGWPVVTGLFLVAAALLTGAGPLGQAWLRGLGLAFGLASVAEALGAAHADTGAQVAVLAVLSAICSVLALSLFVSKRAGTLHRSLLVLGVAFASGAIMAAVGSASTDPMLLALGLASSALQAAAVGVVLRNTVVQMLSPVLACASWLFFSSAGMSDNPERVTVPMGLAMLTVVELWRQDRRQHRGNVGATEIVVLELTGVAFLVGAAFVQAVTEVVAYAVLAAALGLAVTGWGALTTVRRRLATGAAIVLAAVVVLVAVPLVGLLPAWEGAALWVLIAAVGLVALLVASFLEQGKAVAQKGLSWFGQVTAGWE